MRTEAARRVSLNFQCLDCCDARLCGLDAPPDRGPARDREGRQVLRATWPRRGEARLGGADFGSVRGAGRAAPAPGK